jgi:uncharacterized membrane protein
MSVIQESVDVHADTQRVYEMWTEFDHYVDFIPHLKEVRHTGETLMRWVTDYDGSTHEWEMQVIQMDPEKRIVLQTVHQEPPIRFNVTFEPTGEGTRITFDLENAPGHEDDLRRLIQQALVKFKAIADQGPPTRWSLPDTP